MEEFHTERQISIEPPGRSRWAAKLAGVAVSVLFHGGVVATFFVGSWLGGLFDTEPEEEPVEVEYQNVDLLALGEEPDPNTLPRMTGDEAPPQPDPEPQPEPEPEQSPEPEPEPEPDPEELERQREEQRQRERERREQRMEEALGEFDRQGRTGEAPEGSPDGVAGGTTTDPDAANMRQTYRRRLSQTIGRHWVIPTVISDNQLEQLAGSVSVHVQLDESGRIVEWEFRNRSGDERFDQSIERVLRVFDAEEGSDSLPLPQSEDIRDEILRRGMMLNAWEHIEE